MRMNKKIKTSIAIKVIVLTILASMATCLVVLYKNNDNIRTLFDKYVFMKNVYENNLPKIETDSKNIYAFKNSILVFKDNELKAYNKYGREEYSIGLELSSPIFKSNGDYLLVAEKNGGRFYLINNKNIVFEQSFKGNISNIEINKNGQSAITLLGTTDKSVVIVYDEKGEELFSKHIAEDLVVDTALSEDNKYLAIAKVNYTGIDVKSIIETIDIKYAKEGKTEINEYKSELGDLIIKIQYSKKDILICMYDKVINIIRDNNIKQKVDFEFDNVIFADMNNKIISVAKTKDGILKSKIELKMLNIEIDEINSYEIEEPKEIFVNGNIIAINYGSEALILNNSGWLIKEYKTSQEINNIVISNEIAGIVYKNKVEIISF